jgi:hypothetical protein
MNSRYVVASTICAIALAWAVPLFAQTKVGGVLSGENRWDLAGSPYIVECDLLIPRFAHLTIDPGVKVVINKERYIPEKIPQFDALDSGSISFRVEGTLSCVGKRNKRVVFAPQEVDENRLGWYGIIFDKVNGKFNEIAFTDLTGAFYGITIAARSRGTASSKGTISVSTALRTDPRWCSTASSRIITPPAYGCRKPTRISPIRSL